MMKALERYHRVLGLCVLVLMGAVATLATIELGWVLIKDAITPPILLLDLDELLEILGVFLLVLITLELFDAVFKTLNSHHVDHAEVTLRVAIIAVARKVIVLDIQVRTAPKLVALAGLIAALVGGTYILARLRKSSPS